MSLNFTFALSQQQTFELRCDYGSRRLDKTELAALIDLCEQNYYDQQRDSLPYLTGKWIGTSNLPTDATKCAMQN